MKSLSSHPRFLKIALLRLNSDDERQCSLYQRNQYQWRVKPVKLDSAGFCSFTTVASQDLTLSPCASLEPLPNFGVVSLQKFAH